MNWPTPDTRPDAPNTGSNRRNGSASLERAALELRGQFTTPCAQDSTSRKKKRQQGGTPLSMQAEQECWLSPKANDAEKRGRVTPDGRGGLVGQSQSWPTPRAEDSEQVGNHTSPGSHGGDSLGATAKAWSTPNAADSELAGSEKRGSSLNADLKLWTTPKTPTGGPESRASKKARGAGGEDLETQARLFETPSTRDGKRSAGAAKKENSLPGLPTGMTAKAGSESLPDGRKLNPLFDEWLIGWPIGWTCPHTAPAERAFGITAFERWETASTRVLQRWLSAYWRSGLESASSCASHRVVKK